MPNLDYNDFQHEERRLKRSDLLDELNDNVNASLPLADGEQSVYVSSLHGERALARALAQWNETIIEPKGVVDGGPILERYIKEGIKWSWVDSYQNRKFAWCGAFAGWAWKESVKDEIRKKSFPSTYRLREWAKGSQRIIKRLEDAREGDIIIVGKKKAWGDHITLFDRIDGEGYWSVEGNAYGETPEGGPRKEGVIRRYRNVEEIYAIYRPLKVDLNG